MTIMDVNYEVSESDRKAVDAIVERAKLMWPAVDAVSLAMDLTTTHNHVCRLELEDLLAARDLDFAHDVSGIVYYLDRENLNMKHCFVPRFAAREDKE